MSIRYDSITSWARHCWRIGSTASQNGRIFSTHAGYQSLGSFHSENLAELMALDNAVYQAPALPFSPQEPKQSLLDNRLDFLIDFDNWTFLNHGAFGGALASAVHRSDQWRNYLEKQPLRYFDRVLLPHLAHSARCLADFTHAPDKRNVALLPNVTSGMNSVLAGHAREYGNSAVCILWDTSYGSVKKMAQHYYNNGNVIEIPFQSKYLDKLSTAENPQQVFVEALEQFIGRNSSLLEGKHTCLILDQTTSNTALNTPVSLLSTLAKQLLRDVLVVVDGAHGLLAQETKIDELFTAGVDIYLSNGHKWLSAPRGVAFMAVARDSIASSILRRPAVLSHGVDEPDLFSRFVWDGCRDYSAALAIPAVLEYWQHPSDVRQKCRDTINTGMRLLAESWHPAVGGCLPSWPGTVTLVPSESALLSPMALVALPAKFGSENTSADSKRVQDYLYSQNVEVPVKCINGRLYVRISCHVYNRTDDFELLARAINRLG